MPLPEGQRSYAPFDVTEVRPDLKRGEGSEPATGLALVDSEGKALPEFDMRWAEAFNGLVFLGALTARFTWLGHDFVIRTLTQDEVLLAAVMTKPYSGTVGEPKAFTTSLAALAIVTIDGEELPLPISTKPGVNMDVAWAQMRFDYVRKNWFQFTIDKVYDEYLALEGTVTEVINAMGEALGPTESTVGLNANSGGPSDEDFSLVEG